MEAPKKICIILNPVAGYGRSRKLLPEVGKILRENGVQFDVVTTEGPRHAEALAKEASEKGYRAVVAMGGDGTLGEVVNGVLSGSEGCIPVATIPSGTGNDFAGGNRLFSHWSHSIQALVRPVIRKMDVLLLKDAKGFSRYAINSVGFGFDAYVVQRVQELGSKKVGRLSYMLEALRGLLAFKSLDVKVIVDGVEETVKNMWLCAVTNSEKYGGGMIVCPGASSCDGVLNTVYLADVSRASIVSLLFLVFRGRHVGRRGVHLQEAKEVIIDAPGFPCHIDGDTVNVTYPVSVRVVPQALPFFVKA
ncbi:MAG TPA: diacylglycerol kinase family lipid kinase [Firmicutes bacterium]|nr:diacylglycerol kinase family lipid kinase [Candidatus Fermentithermobacillaceae bacterium]